MKLFIEASTSTAVVAVQTPNQTFFVVKEHQQRHSQYLLSMVDEALKQAKTSPSDLSMIVVGEGPGSYTGARIAVTIAKMFAIQLDVPLYRFDSLSLFATNEALCGVLLTMKRKVVLAGVYNMGEGAILHEPAYMDQSEWDVLAQDIKVIIPSAKTFNLDQLQLRKVEDVMSFSPNYAREWQPT